jgi:hypothetical protein
MPSSLGERQQVADLSGLSTEDLLALKSGDLSKVSTAGLVALKGGGPSAAEQVANDPISEGARKELSYTPAELIAGSRPARFALGAAAPFMGLAQLAAHTTGVGKDAIDQTLQETEALKKRGMEAYDQGGVDVVGLAGNVLSPLPLKAGGALMTAAKTLPKKALASAATGGIYGATTPTLKPDEFAKEKAEQIGTGAALGAALPPAGALVKGLGKTIYSAVEPLVPGGPEAILNRFHEKILGPAKDKVIAALESTRQLVPGSEPTAGEAVAGVPGAVNLAAHQRLVAKSEAAAPAFVQRTAEQEGARMGALADVGKTPAELKLAEGARSGEAGRNYETAFGPKWEYDLGAIPGEMEHTLVKGDQIIAGISRQKGPDGLRYIAQKVEPGTSSPSQDASSVLGTDKNLQALKEKVAGFFSPNGQIPKSDPDLEKLLKDPYVKAALPAARDLAKSNGITAKDNLIQFLHYVKVGLDKQLDRTGDGALAATEKKAVRDVKESLLGWMDEKSPAYAHARESFAAASRPIMQMKVGQALQERLQAPLGASERAASYASSLRDPAALIKETGSVRPLEEVLTPDQLSKVQSVGADLTRKAMYDRLSRGSNVSSPDEAHSLLPNLLSRPAMAANWIAKNIFRHNLEENVNKVAGDLYLDPAKLAATLKDKPISERERIVKELLARSQPAVVGAPTVGLAKQF